MTPLAHMTAENLPTTLVAAEAAIYADYSGPRAFLDAVRRQIMPPPIQYLPVAKWKITGLDAALAPLTLFQEAA